MSRDDSQSGAARLDLSVEVLGPLRVTDRHGRELTPDGSLQRRLLSLLVLKRGHVVSADRAIDVLWRDAAPRDPAAALQNHLFRLRRGLPEHVIESVGSGYRLDPSRVDVDADRLAAALTADVAADRSAAARIDQLLARWSGPAYPELDDDDEGRAEAARLEELRVRAIEARAEARLAVGDTDALAAELVALTDAEPLRERPRSLLMATLAATGRHAEALRVYDDFRRRLGDELGTEPSPALTEQHAELLAHAGMTRWSPATRLPVPATSLVGRDRLVDEVLELVERHRLVSLIGPGGVGKTRLLIEVGRRIRALHPRRPVVMCELAATDTDTAVDAVASALAIDARPGVRPIDRVVEVLAGTDVVLLLDNCEHVLDPVAELVERLLNTSADVTMIATSHERLRLQGEQLRVVPPLAVAAGDAAVELFLERARAVAPDFVPGPAEQQLIVEIVERLDGLPLAIELAAARLHTLDVAEIKAGLTDRFALLSAGYRTSSRHGSLGAAVAWSVGLLDDRLQRNFAELSVFAGSFDAAGAAAVCAADAATARAALQQLVERSLVMRVPDQRYMLLETLRAFGAEQLTARGSADEIAGRHALYYLDWIEDADRRLSESDSGALVEIYTAIPELRNALTWLLEHADFDRAGRLVAALRDFGFFRLRADVVAWSERVLRADPDSRGTFASLVWVVAAYASWMAGDTAESNRRAWKSLEVAERSGAGIPSEVAMSCGNTYLFEGQLDEAIQWYARGLELAAHDRSQYLFGLGTEVLALAYAGDPRTDEVATALLDEIGDSRTPYAAYAWYCAAEADLHRDDARAMARCVRAIELAEATRTSFVIGVAGATKASILTRTDPEAAADDYRRLVSHFHRAGMWPIQWTMLRSIAVLLSRLGRHHDSAVLVGAIQATTEGHRIFGADAVALSELGAQLRAELGDEAFEAALSAGAALDSGAVVEHTLHAL
jgi:predicted ATPase/DNA-binding SARP family transcriptional activator